MMNIDEMLKRPGLYEATNRAMHARGQCIHVEVDEEGTAYQLNPQGERDGELTRDGWTPDAWATPIRKQ